MQKSDRLAVVVACMLLLAGGANAKPPNWADEFANGKLRADLWHACAGPWIDGAVQCSHMQAGPGEQLYWNSRIFGQAEGPPPVRAVPALGQIEFTASRLTDHDKAGVAAALIQQGLINNPAKAAVVDSLRSAKWKSAWLESVRQVLPGQTLSVGFLPTADPSYWGGPWGFDHVSGHPYFEVDLAEVTFNSDGTMHVRQSIHMGGPGNTLACTIPSLRPQWLFPTATLAPDGMSLTFHLNGGYECTKPLPRPATGYNVILSQQVAGLAHATTVTTSNMISRYDYVRVTTP